MRLDISGAGRSRGVDAAVRVYYAPPTLTHMLVVTAQNKLLKFDSRNGRILAEVGL